ncbi:MAG: MogA/MoaB family molybdenum cofactor biosynthesis protein [Chloroflexi bacterium]|nr:MogA/MoaB family molybdenum cofactor biosynthesis protein [Chloroflexota bacterium]
MIRVGILTLSDKAARGERVDTSGPAIARMLAAVHGETTYAIVSQQIIPDERDLIETTLQEWADGVDLILTTGGTGLGPRDVTPEATGTVIDRGVPGLAEAIRAESLKRTPFAMLSRGVAGAIGTCLIINLPGSERAVRESLAVVMPVLPHAVELLHGHTEH